MRRIFLLPIPILIRIMMVIGVCSNINKNNENVDNSGNNHRFKMIMIKVILHEIMK